MAETIRYGFAESSLGTFLAAFSTEGLVAFEFADDCEVAVERLRADHTGAHTVEDGPGLAASLATLGALVEHPEQEASFALDLRGNDYEKKVWRLLGDVPAGATVSYGELAARLGTPRGAREVAEACAANRIAILVPCHRVVKKDGSLSGYRWGFRRKRALLARERRAKGPAAA